MYEVRLARQPERYYKRVPPATARQLDNCFDDLHRNPLGSRRVKRLKGFEGLFRYRVGELRVIFSVDRVDRVVKVMTIGPRRDIY